MNVIKKILEQIGTFFKGLKLNSKVWVHIAVDVVQKLKAITDSQEVDVITAITSSEWDDRTLTVIRTWIPRVLLELQMFEAAVDEPDTNKTLLAILSKIQFSSQETRNIVWHGLCATILEKLSDGKFSWSDAVSLGQYYYKNVLGTPQEITPAQITKSKSITP